MGSEMCIRDRFNHEEGKAGEIKELDFTFNASFPSRGWKAFVKREQIYSGLLAPNDSLTIRAFVTVSKCGVVEGKYDDDDDSCDEDSGLEEAFRIPLEEATWSRIVGEAAAAGRPRGLSADDALRLKVGAAHRGDVWARRRKIRVELVLQEAAALAAADALVARREEDREAHRARLHERGVAAQHVRRA